MKIAAIYKWNNEKVIVKPIFYSWHVGMQYAALTGYKASLMFAIGKKDLIFPLQSKLLLVPIKFWHWVKMWLWKQIRYWQPNRFKRFSKQLFGNLEQFKEGELPF